MTGSVPEPVPGTVNSNWFTVPDISILAYNTNQ